MVRKKKKQVLKNHFVMKMEKIQIVFPLPNSWVMRADLLAL